MLAVLSVASATVRPPWRLRLRLGIWAYVLFSIVYVGQMADAEHVIAVALSLPFSSKLAGSSALARPGPCRPGTRCGCSPMVGVLLIAVLQMLANFVPGRLTPFGAPEDEPESWIFLVLNLVISLLHGQRPAQGLQAGLVVRRHPAVAAGARRAAARRGGRHLASSHRMPTSS